MIKKLYNFGKYIPDEYFEDNPLDLNLEYGKNKDKKIAFLCFEEKKGQFSFKGLEVEDYDVNKNLNGYLFKNSKGNSVSPFPTAFYDVKNLKNKMIDFNSKSGSKIIRILEKNIRINDKLSPILKKLEQNKISDKVTVTNNFILSIKINHKFIGQSPFFKKIISTYKEEIFSPFFNKHNTISKSLNSICYFCNQAEEVWGFTDLIDFKFYSTNEDSVIAGGFKKEQAWKNYPVCPHCAEKLFKYKSVLQKNFAFQFYGFSYFLVPEIFFKNHDNKEIINLLTSEDYGLLKLSILKDKIEQEEEIFDLLKESSNFLNYNLFFYKQNNSEFKIILSIDNVFPSRFREIYEAKEKANHFSIFHDLHGNNNNIYNLRFTFKIIKYFFPASKIEGDFSQSFLSIVKAVFVNKKLDYNFVLSRIINKIRNHFINDENTGLATLKAILFIKFIWILGLWNKTESKQKEVHLNNKYEDFFKEHNEFFNSSTKKAVFLEGVLCQYLLNIQYKERSSTPFKARLNSLKIDESIVKRLLPEIINKLEEYDKNYYKELESIISEHLLLSKFSNMTNDEISFYFVMGMNLSKQFKNNQKEEQDGDN